MKKRKTSKILALIMLVISLTVFGVSSYLLYDYYKAINKNEKIAENLEKKVESQVIFTITDDGKVLVPSIDMPNVTGDEGVQEKIDPYELYKDLLAENKDFVGWITIPDTNIDYPVVQTPEVEQYYLRKDFYGNDSRAGTLFCSADSDLKTPSMNIVIYGHHMKAGTMFQNLDNYRDEDFYKEHKYIQFNTLWSVGTYEVIAAFETDLHSDSYPYYKFINGTEEEYKEFIDNAKKLTPYETSDTVYGDQFITLSTCSYHTDNARYVVIAKRIQESEV